MAVSKRVRYEVLRRDGFICRYCKAGDKPLTVDHVIPVSLGGSDDPTNLVAACRECNQGKASTHPGADLVADVDAKSAAWVLALDKAVETRRVRRTNLAQDAEAVIDLWASSAPHWADLPADAEASVADFIVRGLDLADFERAISVALAKQGIPHKARWSYFCGICWNFVREIEAEALAIFGEGV